MPRAKIAVTLDEKMLERIDRLVQRRVFPNRSRTVEAAVREKLERMDRNRLARECAKLDPTEEQAFADEGLSSEISGWPEY